MYTYGLPKRGINPRTLQEDDRPLGQDEVRLCPACRRSLFLRDLRRFVTGNSWALVTLAIAVFGMLAGRSFIEPGGGPSVNVMALFAVVFGLVGFLIAWLRNREQTLEESLFEVRRDALAKRHGRPPKELRLY